MKFAFDHEHPIVAEFYDVWRDSEERIEAMVGQGTDRDHVRKMLKDKHNTAAAVRLWFNGLTEEDQMALVYASTYDSVLYRRIFLYFTENHKLYRKMVL